MMCGQPGAQAVHTLLGVYAQPVPGWQGIQFIAIQLDGTAIGQH